MCVPELSRAKLACILPRSDCLDVLADYLKCLIIIYRFNTAYFVIVEMHQLCIPTAYISHNVDCLIAISFVAGV